MLLYPPRKMSAITMQGYIDIGGEVEGGIPPAAARVQAQLSSPTSFCWHPMRVDTRSGRLGFASFKLVVHLSKSTQVPVLAKNSSCTVGRTTPAREVRNLSLYWRDILDGFDSKHTFTLSETCDTTELSYLPHASPSSCTGSVVVATCSSSTTDQIGRISTYAGASTLWWMLAAPPTINKIWQNHIHNWLRIPLPFHILYYLFQVEYNWGSRCGEVLW